MLIFAAAIFFMSGCEEDARFAARTQYLGGIYGTAPTAGAPHDTVSYWDGDGIGGKPSIKISLGKDLNHVSTKYGDYVDAAGNVVMQNVDVDKDPRPPGSHFQGAPMPYFMRIVGGVGMHAGYLPGYPASHGCIRMPEFMAENFFKSVSAGTPVTITN